MAGRRPQLSLGNATAPTAPPAASDDGGTPESVSAPPTPPAPPSGRTDPGTAGSAPAGAYPGPVRGAPRTPGGDMPKHKRQEWRHRLRASAGKLARAYADAVDAEDGWEALAQEAEQAGVPAHMLTAALADAGVPEVAQGHAPA